MRERTTDEAPALARFEAFSDLESAGPAWRRLEAEGALSTPYQRRDWIAAWHRHAGRGAAPLIVVGYRRDGGPGMLLPLGIRGTACRTAGFLGGRHANFNMPIWDRTTAAEASAGDVGRLLSFLRAFRPRIDLVALLDQPLSWNGAANPLAAAATRPAPHAAWAGEIGDAAPGGRRLRAKARIAAALGEVRYWQPETAADVETVLEAFLVQKAARLRSAGIPDAFAGEDVRDFLRAATRRGPDAEAPAIELFAMSVGDRIAAVYGGSGAGTHFSFCFNSIAEGDISRCSPGLLLLANALPPLRARGYRRFDLGIGDARYKRTFCPEPQMLGDLILPLTARGMPAAAGLKGFQTLKRAVKETPVLAAALRRTRRALAAFRSVASAPEAVIMGAQILGNPTTCPRPTPRRHPFPPHSGSGGPTRRS